MPGRLLTLCILSPRWATCASVDRGSLSATLRPNPGRRRVSGLGAHSLGRRRGGAWRSGESGWRTRRPRGWGEEDNTSRAPAPGVLGAGPRPTLELPLAWMLFQHLADLLFPVPKSCPLHPISFQSLHCLSDASPAALFYANVYLP